MARSLVRAFRADPVGVLRALPGHVRMQVWRDRAFPAQESWNQHLHHLLGASWPCQECGRAEGLVSGIGVRLADRGLAVGRHTYGGYSDSDASLACAVWCAVRHVKPSVVVETGVARGVTSRIVLEALNENDHGHLWSIDLPHPFDRSLHAQTGAAVTDTCRPRWTYVEGSSRQRLPQVVREVGHVEVFIHDSLHTAKNTRFEMDRVAAVMRPGGIMLIDDISTHDGFATFARDHPDYQTVICPSADRVGLFGVAVKTGS